MRTVKFLPVVLAIVLLSGVVQTAQAQTSDLQANKALVLRICQEGINLRKWSVIDEVFTKDAVLHEATGDTTVQGYRDSWLPLVAAMPDLKISPLVTIAEKDLVADMWYLEGTFTNPFVTPQGTLKPTGKSYKLNGIRLARIKDGKIVEFWNMYDTLLSGQQLGAVPVQGELPVVKQWEVKLETIPTTLEQNKTSARQGMEIWSSGNTSHVKDVWASDILFRYPLAIAPQPLNFDAMLQRIQTLHDSFRDFTIKPEFMVAEGNLVVVPYTWEGVFAKSSGNIPPNNAKISARGINLVRIKDGKIAEIWDNWDSAAAITQMMAPKT